MDKIKQEKSGPSPSARITRLALILSGLSLLAAILSGFGSRWGLWHFSFGFKVLAAGALGGGVSSAIALAGLAFALHEKLWRDLSMSFIALSLGLAVFGLPFSWYLAAKHLPKIHDVTTDTENPPQFVALLPLRKDAPNPSVYGGPEIALKQLEAYPDIKPLVLDLPSEKAFDRALAAARGMSWKIVNADREELRIEATDSTFWFGFKDDIVVRTTPLDGKSRIDVRSLSRVGLSDVGTNAARIRKYLTGLSGKGR